MLLGWRTKNKSNQTKRKKIATAEFRQKQAHSPQINDIKWSKKTKSQDGTAGEHRVHADDHTDNKEKHRTINTDRANSVIDEKRWMRFTKEVMDK